MVNPGITETVPIGRGEALELAVVGDLVRIRRIIYCLDGDSAEQLWGDLEANGQILMKIAYACERISRQVRWRYMSSEPNPCTCLKIPKAA